MKHDYFLPLITALATLAGGLLGIVCAMVPADLWPVRLFALPAYVASVYCGVVIGRRQAV